MIVRVLSVSVEYIEIDSTDPDDVHLGPPAPPGRSIAITGWVTTERLAEYPGQPSTPSFMFGAPVTMRVDADIAHLLVMTNATEEHID